MDKKEMDLFPPNQSVKEPKVKKNNSFLLVAFVIGAFILAIFVIRPAVLGYGVYQQAEASNLTVQDYAQNMQQLTRDLELVKTNLSSYSTFTGALLAQVDEKTDEITECKVQLGRAQSDLERAQEQIIAKETEIVTVKGETQALIDQQVTEKTQVLEQEKIACESSLQSKESEVGEVQAKYDQLVKNTVKTICCKAKVDNPEINFYEVVDNKISCLEQGSNQLSC